MEALGEGLGAAPEKEESKVRESTSHMMEVEQKTAVAEVKPLEPKAEVTVPLGSANPPPTTT